MWRNRDKSGIGSMTEALKFLENYRWSSYLDYAGRKNFPSILSTSLFKVALGNYPASLRECLYDAEANLDMLHLE